MKIGVLENDCLEVEVVIAPWDVGMLAGVGGDHLDDGLADFAVVLTDCAALGVLLLD